MKKKVVILTLSEKWHKKCIVAYDIECDRLLRLVSNPIDGAGIPKEYIVGINLLDEVEIKIINTCPIEHQTENVLIDLDYGIRKTGDSHDTDILDMLISNSDNVFGNNYYKLKDTKNLNFSIQIVEFKNMNISINSSNKTKANFYLNNTYHNNYSITDKNYYNCTRQIPSGYAIISIPPSDDFTNKGNGYYKYVSAIYESKRNFAIE